MWINNHIINKIIYPIVFYLKNVNNKKNKPNKIIFLTINILIA